jgi:hypothetical protein
MFKVGIIEPEGIKKIVKKKVRMNNAIKKAETIVSTVSLKNGFFGFWGVAESATSIKLE